MQAALLLTNGDCAPLAQLPSLSPSQWTVTAVAPQILNVAMTNQQSCVHCVVRRVTDMHSTVELAIACDAAVQNATIWEVIELNDYHYVRPTHLHSFHTPQTALLKHCSACDAGCPVTPVMCSALSKSLVTKCNGEAFNLQSVQGGPGAMCVSRGMCCVW